MLSNIYLYAQYSEYFCKLQPISEFTLRIILKSRVDSVTSLTIQSCKRMTKHQFIFLIYKRLQYH